jgi:hypothetical protein
MDLGTSNDRNSHLEQIEKPPEMPAVDDAINMFYKLKHRYDDAKANIAEKHLGELRGAARKRAAKTLPKPPCVGCRRAVGPIFTAKSNDDDDQTRAFRVVCGANIGDNPCSLNIHIITIQSLSFDEAKRRMSKVLAGTHNILPALLHTKNQIMFFGKQVYLGKDVNMADYDVDTVGLNIEYERYVLGRIFEVNLLRNENPENIRRLEDNKKTLAQFIKTFKELVRTPGSLHAAMTLYVNDMRPLLDTILAERFDVSEVVRTNNECVVNQVSISLKNREFVEGDDTVVPRVLAFDLGMSIAAPAPSKNNNINGSRQQTRRTMMSPPNDRHTRRANSSRSSASTTPSSASTSLSSSKQSSS